MSVEVLILGSNAAAFAHRRHHTAQLVTVQHHKFLVDCGEATQLLLKRNGVKVSTIDHILISHLHGDHYFGLIGLLSTLHLFGRKKELHLIGPPGLKEIIALQFRYSETSLGFKIHFKEFTPGTSEVVFDTPKYQVVTLPMDHSIPCMGYLFKEKPKSRKIIRALMEEYKISRLEMLALKEGKDILNEAGQVKHKNSELTQDPSPAYSYAYCADTRFKPALKDLIAQVDLLYHEATFGSEMKDRAQKTYHSTAAQAGEMALLANVKKLILGHFSARYQDLAPILEEAKTVFSNTELATEGTTFKLYEI